MDSQMHSKIRAMTLPVDRNETIGYQQEVARLEALLEASRRIHSLLRLDDVLHCVLEIASKELEAEGAFFVPSEAIGPVTRAYGYVPTTIQESMDCQSFPLVDRREQKITSLVIFRPGYPLSLEETDFVEGLAVQASAAIETVRQHEKLLAWDRVQQELAAARAIQRSLLPQTVPQIQDYSVAWRSNPCFEVGGDYVDIINLPGGRLMLVVADVAGKGLASALVGGSFRAAFRAMAMTEPPLDELAFRMNELHYGEGVEARRRYVSAILMRLDSASHTIECVNAGHNPPFLLDCEGGHKTIDASGPPLGMLPSIQYTVEHHRLEPGGKLLLYTDGLIEVFRGQEEFGAGRLLEGFRDCQATDCDAMLETLWRQIEEYAASAKQSDDMTALALARTGQKDSPG
jgi:serine phosphatase RsbU (regulator of sigma subunit)